MSKFRMLMFAVIGVLFSGMTVFAQGAVEAGDNASSVIARWQPASDSRSQYLVVRLVSRASVRRRAKALPEILVPPAVFRQ